ncbi:MAG: hypothetical protein ACE5R6_01860 [Candidatus Heimdallarchaeota archaeon]
MRTKRITANWAVELESLKPVPTIRTILGGSLWGERGFFLFPKNNGRQKQEEKQKWKAPNQKRNH